MNDRREETFLEEYLNKWWASARGIFRTLSVRRYRWILLAVISSSLIAAVLLESIKRQLAWPIAAPLNASEAPSQKVPSGAVTANAKQETATASATMERPPTHSPDPCAVPFEERLIQCLDRK